MQPQTLRRWAALAVACTSLCASAGAAAKINRSFGSEPGSDRLVARCTDSTTHAVLACPDNAVIPQKLSDDIRAPYERGEFDQLEKTFAAWRGGGEQFADGTWALALYLQGLGGAMTTLTADSEKLAKWKQTQGNTEAAQLAEALMWYVHARRVTGYSVHEPVSAEAKAIARERLAKAGALLAKLRPRMQDSPAFFELQILVLVEQGLPAQARKVFNTAVKRFPQYQPMYSAMSRAYTGDAFAAFVDQSVRLTEKFEGRGAYARLYLLLDDAYHMHAQEKWPAPSWERLREAYDDLVQRYPSSLGIVTSYAAVACRSDDSELYRRLRTRADAYLIADVFTVIPLEACDRHHGWTAAAPK